MTLTAEDWPIAAALLPFGSLDTGSLDPGGFAETCASTVETLADAGFGHLDLTDSWVRYGDLSPELRATLIEAMRASEVKPASMSLIRRSIIDEVDGDEHLAYGHRSIELAAELGVGVVSMGLHRALTPEQQRELWFWTVPGHRDSETDSEAWDLAVTRFRELGRHAADLGMLLSLELYEHTFLGTARSAVRLVEDIGLDTVGLNPDIGNLVRLHEPVESWRHLAEATLPYANFWHVKNYTRDEDPRTGVITTVPTYLESGVIDYRTAVAIALESGFQGVICSEHYGGDGLSMSAANQEYLRRRILPRRPRAVGSSRVRQQFAGSAS